MSLFEDVDDDGSVERAGVVAQGNLHTFVDWNNVSDAANQIVAVEDYQDMGPGG